MNERQKQKKFKQKHRVTPEKAVAQTNKEFKALMRTIDDGLKKMREREKNL